MIRPSLATRLSRFPRPVPHDPDPAMPVPELSLTQGPVASAARVGAPHWQLVSARALVGQARPLILLLAGLSRLRALRRRAVGLGLPGLAGNMLLHQPDHAVLVAAAPVDHARHVGDGIG